MATKRMVAVYISDDDLVTVVKALNEAAALF
jgi:hypothetical protein